MTVIGELAGGAKQWGEWIGRAFRWIFQTLTRGNDGKENEGVEIPRGEKGGGESKGKGGGRIRARLIHGAGWVGLVAWSVRATEGRVGAHEPEATRAELAEALPSVIVLPAIPDAINASQRRLMRSLEPEMQWLAIEHYNRAVEEGFRIQFNSGRRTPDEQAQLSRRTEAAAGATDTTTALNDAGLSGFAAAPNKSLHVPGLAYDGEPVPKNEGTWLRYGELAEELGATWGGRWRKTLRDGTVRTDRPHVQLGAPVPRRVAIAAASVAAVAVISASVAASRIVDRTVRG